MTAVPAATVAVGLAVSTRAARLDPAALEIVCDLPGHREGGVVLAVEVR